MRRFPIVLAVVSCVILVGCDKCSNSNDTAETAETNAMNEVAVDDPTQSEAITDEIAAVETTVSEPQIDAGTPQGELQITDIKVGEGTEAADGKKVTVHYTGTLTDGTKFDSSKDRGTPFSFVLGSGMVIQGWDQGVKGMKEGGVRKLIIPSHLAYGSRGAGAVIPPNSTLVFEVELLKVE